MMRGNFFSTQHYLMEKDMCYNVWKLNDDRIITFSIHCLKTKMKTVRQFVVFLIITGSLVSHVYV